MSLGRFVAVSFSLIFLVSIPLCETASAQHATPVTVPLFQPAYEFGPYTADLTPTSDNLTATEEANLSAAIGNMPVFPQYIFSGCHDRAHAAYMLLPQVLRAKVMKIWAIAPSQYTAVIPGQIGLKGTGAAQKVFWGYHVALAYRSTVGDVMVIDPVLKPKQSLSSSQWFDLMKLPRMTLWTLTKGDVYLIQASTLNPSTSYAQNTWNGYLVQPKWDAVAANIARDLIGADATAGSACADINGLAERPNDLSNYLSRPLNSVPALCRASLTKFASEKSAWQARLPSDPVAN